MILILHFRFRERRVVINAPVHRLQPAIHIALLVKIHKRARDRRLIAKIHRQVRTIPLPKHTQPPKLYLMVLDERRRKLPAHLPKFRRRNFRRLPAQFLLDLRLDRQPVAVPTRNIWRPEPGHGLRLHDHVLQHLIQPGAQVNLARGIRRSVVQHKKRCTRARFQNALVEARRFPRRQLLRLALRQLCLHREVGLRKIQRLLQVNVLSHVWVLKPFSTVIQDDVRGRDANQRPTLTEPLRREKEMHRYVTMI